MPYGYGYGAYMGMALGDYGLYLALLLVVIVFSVWAQIKVKSTYNRFNAVDNERRLTGAQTARYILDQNGLQDVEIVPISGQLTDNYNPKTNTVSLSADVYNGTTVAAMGIAAHEVGHAIQHNTGYIPIKIRAAMVPVVSFGANISWLLIIIGLFVNSISEIGYTIAVVGVILFAMATVFHFVTLPVELNASSRAKKHIYQLVSKDSVDGIGVRKVLSAAAMTYVAALAVSLLNLLRVISIVSGRKRN